MMLILKIIKLHPGGVKTATLLVLLATTVAIIEICAAIVLGRIISHMISNEQGKYTEPSQEITFAYLDMKGLLLIFMSIAIIKFCLSLYQVKIQNRFGFGMQETLSTLTLDGIYKSIQRGDKIDNSGKRISEITYDISLFCHSFLIPLAILCSDALLVVALSLLMFYFEPVATITVIILMASVFQLFISITNRRIRGLGKTRKRADAEMLNTASEYVIGAFEIHHAHAREKFTQNFKLVASKSAKVGEEYNTLNSLPRISIDIILFLTLLVLYVSNKYLDNRNDSSLFIINPILIGAMLKIVPVLLRIGGYVQSIKYSMPVLSKLEVITLQITNDSASSDVSGVARVTLGQSVSFTEYSVLVGENKSIQYKPFSLKKGQKYLLVGSSGSGKTTLMRSLIGELDVSCVISSEGVINCLKNKRLVINGAIYVNQSPYIFTDTVLNNVTMRAGDSIDYERLNRAIKISCFDEVLEGLPGGLNTIIGPAGFKLSGGQKQRLAVARASYLNSEVLLLDEPSSALDQPTELRLMQNLLGEKNLTLVVISHSPRFTTVFDEIINI
jgi:ABC-type multidrug transport system fused ATPase/permease subunit